MSAVARRWIRVFCPTCEEPTEFELRTDWSSVCTQCGTQELRLAANGLLRLIA